MAPAGFWQRYVAWSLDATLLLVATCVLTRPQLAATAAGTATRAQALFDRLATALVAQPQPHGDLLAFASALSRQPELATAGRELTDGLHQGLAPPLIVLLLLALAYHAGFEQSRWQATPGKRLLALVVTDCDGAAPSWPRSLLRNGAGLLSWLSLNLGHALAALPPQRRALHDFIAGTRVLARQPQLVLPRWARAWLFVQVALMLLLWIAAGRWMLAALDLALLRAIG